MNAKAKLEASLLVQALSFSDLRDGMTRKVAPLLVAAATVLSLGMPGTAQAQSSNSTNIACQVAGGALGGLAGYVLGGNNSAAQRGFGVAGGAAGTIAAKAACDALFDDPNKQQPGYSAGNGNQQRPSPAVERGMRNSSAGHPMSSADTQGVERLARSATSTMQQWMDAEQLASSMRHRGSPDMAEEAANGAAEARDRFVFEAQNFRQTVGEMSRQFDTSRFRSITTVVGHMANVAESGNYRTYDDLQAAMQTARNRMSNTTAATSRANYSPRP